MKFIIVLIILPYFLCITSCKPKGESVKEGETYMEMDSVYTIDKNITIVNPKDEISLIESMKNFEDNPNIMETDIDAGKNIQSSEIQYVKPNDTIRLNEPGRKKDK